MKPKFDRKWTPLIGRESSTILWRLALLGVLDSPLIVVSIAVALLAQSHLVLYVGLSTSPVVTVAFFARVEPVFEGLLELFGRKITMANLPPLYPDRFRFWCEKNGISTLPRNP